MRKYLIEKIEIIPYEKGLYSFYLNSELICHASAKYMGDIIKEYMLNSQNEENNDGIDKTNKKTGLHPRLKSRGLIWKQNIVITATSV